MDKGFVTGLPRSRTYWFSEYFKGLGQAAHHEFLNGCKSKKEFYDMKGINCDCGLYLTDFQEMWDAPTVIVHRPILEVIESLSHILNITSRLLEELGYANKCLDKMEGLHIDYQDINNRMPEIHAYMLGTAYDEEYGKQMLGNNLQLSEITGSEESYQLWVA